MPLVAHSNLPTFDRLLREGGSVLPPDRAAHQDIRELHIGLLNMMPDAALEATERQFYRIVGESNQIAQFYIHPFTLKELARGTKGQQHVQQHYESFDQLQSQGLDALIVTGANVTQLNLSAEPFWSPLIEIIEWAYDNVTSTLCSCLATQAVMEFKYGQKRRHLGFKRWGVYRHQVVDRVHPLVSDVNTLFDVPHSRFNQIDREQFDAAGLPILVESKDAGVHLAVSKDKFRLVFFQGHPEYDTISLYKEYKREVSLYSKGKRDSYPPLPHRYFGEQAQAILDEYRQQLVSSIQKGKPQPIFPENIITAQLNNTWHDTAEGVINNWIGKVYQTTNSDRKRPFMSGIDQNNPLGL